MIAYWTAFSIGLLGSLHCIGMCGPIALALPLDRSNRMNMLSGSLIYNTGRLITYASLGLLFGFVGQGFALAGFQQGLSILIGLIMILTVIWPILKVKRVNISSFSLWLGKLKGLLGAKLGRQSNSNLFMIGILNGLLPCGLIYVAIAAASAMAAPIEGALYMSIFALGTMPALMLVNIYGMGLRKKYFVPMKRYIPVFVVLMGALFILRGMNLGIPYLSPELNSNAEIISCH